MLFLWGIIMLGLDYQHVSPKFIPLLAFFTGLSSIVYGYFYLLEFKYKTRYLLGFFAWTVFHFFSLIFTSFGNITAYGPTFAIVLSWMMLGVTFSVLTT